MARVRSPNSIEAEQLYHDGMKLVDIAKQFGVPASTVRRWKSTQKWDDNNPDQCKKKQNERSDNSDKSKANVRKSRGAPKGNKNAVGHVSSVPKRNKNAEKHGAYSTIYWDALDEEEVSLMQEISHNEEELLQQQIAMYSVRERKFMHQIKKFKEKSEKGLYVKGVTKKVRTDFDENGNKSGKVEETNTDTEYAIKGLATLEAELTKIQRAKTKCIDSLIRLRIADERHDYLMNGWKSKMEDDNAGIDNGEADDVMIYLPENGRDKK
ncbi:MAG: hypothetical protein HFI60_02265 [Lachnospiraceae bacterium]|jgi:uncharacterized protein YjcR|nr:hypothetical protein [Lachnospiraceae bacterium]